MSNIFFIPLKHLNKNQISEISEMQTSGMTNPEVAKHFKVSVATVNNHKTRIKGEGMSFPSKRGRRLKEQSGNVIKENAKAIES